MTYEEVTDAFNKAILTPAECSIGFWVGPDGIFHWLNWMEKLYGSEAEDPRFEKEWLTVISATLRVAVQVRYLSQGTSYPSHTIKPLCTGDFV